MANDGVLIMTGTRGRNKSRSGSVRFAAPPTNASCPRRQERERRKGKGLVGRLVAWRNWITTGITCHYQPSSGFINDSSGGRAAARNDDREMTRGLLVITVLLREKHHLTVTDRQTMPRPGLAGIFMFRPVTNLE